MSVFRDKKTRSSLYSRKYALYLFVYAGLGGCGWRCVGGGAWVGVRG